MNIYSKYSDLTEREEYKESQFKKSRVKTGQLKLLFMEILFFSKINLPLLVENHNNIVIIYIGSAPGNHIPILYDLYDHPHINKWILYDKEKHSKELSKRSRIEINNKYVDVAEFKRLKKRYKDKLIILISDIRTFKEGESPTTENIVADNNLQNSALTHLSPLYGSLKLRAAFPNEKFKPIQIPQGVLYLQCFAPQYSTELRLFVSSLDGKYTFSELSIHDSKEIEEKMFYYNDKIRPMVMPDFQFTQPTQEYAYAWKIWTEAKLINTKDYDKKDNIIMHFISLIKRYSVR